MFNFKHFILCFLYFLLNIIIMFEIKKIDVDKCPCVDREAMIDIFGEEFVKLISKISQREGILFVKEKPRDISIGDELIYNETEFLVISINDIGALLISASCGLLYWDYR